MKYLSILFTCFVSLHSYAQKVNGRPIKVLFIGNSYTYYNNLPQIVSGIAASVGDVVVTDQATVGGYSLKQHFSDKNTLDKIVGGTPDYNNEKGRSSWDYVVLQDHSRLPSNPIKDVEQNVFRYAYSLDSMIHKYNPAAKSVFYMTWGRKDGDSARCQEWKPVCTYLGMDSLLALRYAMMAESNNALLSPVGAVWRLLREKYPSLELYNADKSHPSEVGSYAAACCFYSVFFSKDPTLIKYNYTLSPSVASDVRRVVKQVVFNKQSKWYINK